MVAEIHTIKLWRWRGGEGELHTITLRGMRGGRRRVEKPIRLNNGSDNEGGEGRDNFTR